MATEPTTKSEPKNKKKNMRFALIFAALIIVGGTYGIIKYLHAQKHEETDDAQIDANISPVIPRVSGYIKEVRVRDNQHVQKGDTLIILDDKDYRIKVEAMEAALAAAKGNAQMAKAGIPVTQAEIASSQTQISTIDAQIEAAKVNVWRTSQDFKRYANLIKDHSITQQQYEQASAARQIAAHQLQILQAQKRSAASQTAAASTQKGVTAGRVSGAQAAVQQAQAALDAAKLNLSYTIITASVDGQVSNVNLQPGQLLQAGQALFNIVPAGVKWVIANFKETQLSRMKVGQRVIVHVDAYPNHDFEARVGSFSPATGSKFSLLPPDNASGNFVKVVQRLPVKIEFVHPEDTLLKKLRAGMNVDVDVHLKEMAGH
jgi:membrane fusion protein (multidrug efflux system)